jgi:hypothetical protein
MIKVTSEQDKFCVQNTNGVYSLVVQHVQSA